MFIIIIIIIIEAIGDQRSANQTKPFVSRGPLFAGQYYHNNKLGSNNFGLAAPAKICKPEKNVCVCAPKNEPFLGLKSHTFDEPDF